MDITNLISVYGFNGVQECIQCHGEGCNSCANFGYYIATKTDAKYTYTYPLFVEEKKREDAAFIKNASLALATILFIFALVIAYIINITNG